MSEEKKKKKRGNTVFPILTIIIIIILALLFLLSYIFGFGFGFGNSSGNGDGNETGISRSMPAETETDETQEEVAETEEVTENPEDVTETPQEETETPVFYLDVTVSGSTVILNENETSPEDVVSEANSADTDVIVRITDESAVQNTMQELISALESAEINYIIE